VQQELVQSESRYRSLVDTGGAGIATVNLAGEMTFVNDAICQMIGYEREELLGRPFAGFVDPADLPELEKLFLDAVGGNRERPVIEFRLMRKDGGHLWALTNPREMEHEKKLVGFSAIIHDISVLKLTEQSLRESEVKFREMSDMLPQVVFEADVTGRFIYVNKFGYEMFGYTPEDLANGLYMIQTVKHEERKRTLTVYDRILDGRSTSDEFTALRKNGSTFSSIIYTNPVIRENKVVGIRGVVADITVIREAQKALQESEQKYRSVVENAREGILVVQDGQFKYANDALIGFTRYTWEDARKLATDGKFTDVIHPDDRDRVYQNYFKRMSGESSPGQYEFRFIDKDGSVKWLELRATQFTWEGRPATLSFITNVTARKQAEEALRQSEEKYRMLVENTSEYIWTSDMNLKISYVSPAVTSILGYSQEEALEIPVEKGITPASLETVARVFLDGLAADKAGRAAPGRVVTFEAEFIRKDGTTVWAETSVVFVRDASGKTVAIQGVTRDISLRKKAEEALKKSEERYRLLAENALDVIFTTDLGGKITYLSPSVRYLGGYTIEETLQMQTKAPGYDEIFGISMDEIARMRQITQEVLQNPSVARSLEFEFNHRDGFKGWAELKISVARDSDGKTTGVQGVIRDVSAQKKMTEKLIRADRMASLGEMAAGLAHEVNNPLTAVMGFAYLLQQNTTLSAEVKNDVDAIYKEGKRAADVIKNFLLFARGQKLEKQSIYINDIIEGVLRLRQSQMLKENITLTLNLSDDLPAVQGDVSQLQQLFLNLILNAEYFMFRTNRRGNLYIESGQLENRVMVIIKDDGPGVSAEKLGRIFDPFYTTKDVGEGTGLGLSICHGIAREHGGSIRVDSEPGKGATFTVELPAVK
jgi:two-component system NtrC family sensor kinase